MPKVTDLVKRLVVGRALRSTELHGQLLPKRVALPVFASDALSSVAYAPQEILVILSIAGVAAYNFSPWVAVGVVVIMLTVVASYRQNVHAYPSGGGDYEVATVNLGPNAGLTVASALLVDYVLTVAVSVANGVDYVGATIPFVATHKPLVAILIVVVLTLMNLRGIRESGIAFAVPTYLFMASVIGMILWGLFRLIVLGDQLRAPTAGFDVVPEEMDLAGFALAFLVLRAFASGCAALTGVEAISNGVPAFRKPKSRNAATTLLLMGTVAVSMFGGIIFLGLKAGVTVAEPAHVAGGLLRPDGTAVGPNYYQEPIISQVASAVFGPGTLLFILVSAVTALILFLAANTAFNGFPVLGSILAQDRYLPRQLHTRGDRLAFSNGIIILAAGAGLLIWAFDADVSKLLNLYIVGVFVSFTLSQTGMVRHWTRMLRTETDAKVRFQMMRARVINGFGGVMTGVVLVVVLITKFTHGAYIVCIAMPVLFLMMKGIRHHYDAVATELSAPEDDIDASMLPARNHAIVLVSKIHKPTLRALAYARATRPSTLEAVSVGVDPAESQRLQEEWDRRGIPVTLKILDSPYREITRPILEYVKSLRRRSPRDVVTVYIPEYVVGRWWEHLLHNQSALRLKAKLLFKPGVMVTSVPWQLQSADRVIGRVEPAAPGSVRRPYGSSSGRSGGQSKA
ncbi:amino acid permease [Herbidospora sp. NEAU-GS84]|uniref:Amino acid permease n=1 Tax=Herbidospora solisilvae TaxID=2696284 RepID=A0A7C9JCF1_9ACTN|nr:APC family permease [Herbidospora solisilvae]NAS21623.1 amino acid permease [Herbidospora solisilvae]